MKSKTIEANPEGRFKLLNGGKSHYKDCKKCGEPVPRTKKINICLACGGITKSCAYYVGRAPTMSEDEYES